MSSLIVVVELRQIDQVRLAEVALLLRRLGGERLLAQLGHGRDRLDLERRAVLAVELAALEDDAGRLDLRGPAGLVAREDAASRRGTGRSRGT